MSGRAKRLAATAGAAVVLAAGSSVLGAGAAYAATPTTPIVIGDCSTTISGAPGTPVTLRPSAVVDIATGAVSSIPLAGPVLARTVRTLLSGLRNIPIGTVPASHSGSGHVSGGTIAHDVTGMLSLPGSALSPVTSALAAACGVTMKVVDTAGDAVNQGDRTLHHTLRQVAPNLVPSDEDQGSGGTSPPRGGDDPSDGESTSGHHQPTAPGSGSGSGSGSGQPTYHKPAAMPDYSGFVASGVPYGGSLIAELARAKSPQERYGTVPFATPGLFAPAPGVRYGGAVPGYAPLFGVLGKDALGKGNPSVPSDNPSTHDPVRNAGHAQALNGARAAGDDGVGVPLLLAVLALSGVTGALVRTWMLRAVRRSTGSA